MGQRHHLEGASFFHIFSMVMCKVWKPGPSPKIGTKKFPQLFPHQKIGVQKFRPFFPPFCLGQRGLTGAGGLLDGWRLGHGTGVPLGGSGCLELGGSWERVENQTRLAVWSYEHATINMIVNYIADDSPFMVKP